MFNTINEEQLIKLHGVFIDSSLCSIEDLEKLDFTVNYTKTIPNGKQPWRNHFGYKGETDLHTVTFPFNYTIQSTNDKEYFFIVDKDNNPVLKIFSKTGQYTTLITPEKESNGNSL